MKKKLIGIATLAALMTLSAGITAFAGWELDETGQYMFRNSNGNFVYANWVTDPDTGYEYYVDPDGHIMKGTTVEGYWLDDDGIKRDKSEAEIAAEERRAAREAAYYTPAKENTARNEVASEAKAAGVAATTTRVDYQAEMYSLSDSAFAGIKKGLESLGIKDLKGSTTNNNLTTTFWYNTKEGTEIISSAMPKAAKDTNAYYEYAEEIHYNRNLIHDESSPYFDEGFQKLLTAALGEVQGAYVYDTIMAQPVGEDVPSLSFDGITDTGNSYTVRYSTNNAYIQVTCSEIVPVVEEAEAAELTDEYVAAEEGEDVIVSGEAAEQVEEDIEEAIAEDVAEYEEEVVESDYEEEVEEEEEEA